MTFSITWNQHPGDVVDSYTISYTEIVEECIGLSGYTSTNSIPGIDGSTRSYTLTNLEENGVYSVNVSAINGAGNATSMSCKKRTAAAGMFYLQNSWIKNVYRYNNLYNTSTFRILNKNI